MNLSDNDANSTQLEGKKLKGRGARLIEEMRKKGYYMDGQALEIEKDTPAILDTEIEEDLEIDQEYSRESKLEREQRLKREAQIAQRVQLDSQKQQQQPEQSKNANKEIEQIERGMLQARNKGKPITETKFKQDRAQGYDDVALKAEIKEEKKADNKLIRTDMAVAEFVLGDNAKNMNFSDDVKLAEKGKPPSGSIPATKVEDIRSKTGKGIELV